MPWSAPASWPMSTQASSAARPGITRQSSTGTTPPCCAGLPSAFNARGVRLATTALAARAVCGSQRLRPVARPVRTPASPFASRTTPLRLTHDTPDFIFQAVQRESIAWRDLQLINIITTINLRWKSFSQIDNIDCNFHYCVIFFWALPQQRHLPIQPATSVGRVSPATRGGRRMWKRLPPSGMFSARFSAAPITGAMKVPA